MDKRRAERGLSTTGKTFEGLDVEGCNGMLSPSPEETRRERVIRILEAHEMPLLRYAMRLVHDEHAARDAVQHTFLRLCEQPMETLTHVRPWLYAVCRNRALDWLRMQKKSPALVSDECDNCFGHERDPADEIEQRDLNRLVSKLIQRLATEQQELLQLWSSGFRYKEIAKVTDRTEVSVRVAIHRILGQLRQHPSVQLLLDRNSNWTPMLKSETSP